MDEEGAYRWPFPKSIYFSPLTDLNAMHETEKVLTELQVCAYDTELCKVVMRDWSTKATLLKSMDWHATACQRAEAFLRAIGKWEDEPSS